MKILMTYLIVALIILACADPKSANTGTISNEELVTQYFEYFNNHEWEKMAAMYTDTALFKDPSFGHGIVKQTRQQTKEKYAALNKLFPDLHDTVIQTYRSGDHNMIVEFLSTGTAPDSSRFELPICTIFTIENGLISKDFTYYDNFEAQ